MGKLLNIENKDDEKLEIINSITSLLEKIVANFGTSLVMNGDNYKELHLILSDISILCDDFESIDFNDIPVVNLKDNIHPLLTRILNLFQVVANGKETIKNLEHLYYDAANLYSEAYNQLVPIISYNKTKKLSKHNIIKEEELNQLYDKFKSNFSQLVEQGNKTQVEHKTLLQEAKTLAQHHGKSRNAEYFQTEAKSHKIKARCWVASTFLLAFLTIGFALFSHKILPSIPGDTLTPDYISQVLAPKATVLVILVYMLNWSAKNQKAHNHNYIINKHRENALNTFLAFVLPSEDTPEIKNAILMQTTQCIFSPQNSAYTVSDKEPDITKLVELLKPNAKGS